MAAEKRDLEVQGKSVDEAIEKGLAQLGVARGDVIVEVVDEGSAGFLGIGGRDAMVRLSVLGQPKTEARVVEPSKPVAEVSERSAKPAAKPVVTEADAQLEADFALDVVTSLLDKMGVEATISLSQTEPDDLTGETRTVIDVRGQDMGVLIGPRGETLNALQYIARIMAGHQLHQRPTFIIDVEGYRERREQSLASLANRMADKAVRSGRPITLEPMPPNERRIIHLTLRQDNRVRTESTGEGQRRKVRIFPN